MISDLPTDVPEITGLPANRGRRDALARLLSDWLFLSPPPEIER